MSVESKRASGTQATSDALIERYRDASHAIGETPNPRVKAAVLTYAQSIADSAQRADTNGTASTIGASRKNARAANDGMWRYAAAAAIVTAGLTALFTTMNRPETSQVASHSTSPTEPAASKQPATPPDAAMPAPAVVAQSAIASNQSPTQSKPNEARVIAPPTGPIAQATRPPLTASRDAGAVEKSSIGASAAMSPPSSVATTAPSVAAASPSATAAAAATVADSHRAESTVTAAEPMIAFNETRKRAATESSARTEFKSRDAESLSTDKLAVASQPSVAAAPPPPSVAAAPQMSPPVGASRAQRSASAQPSGTVADSTQRGMDDARVQTEMRAAVASRDVARVNLAIRAGGDVNQANTQGSPLLIVATQAGSVDVVSALLGAGAAVDRRDASGMTALDIARRNRNQALIELLTKAGAR